MNRGWWFSVQVFALSWLPGWFLRLVMLPFYRACNWLTSGGFMGRKLMRYGRVPLTLNSFVIAECLRAGLRPKENPSLGLLSAVGVSGRSFIEPGWDAAPLPARYRTSFAPCKP